LAGGGPLGGDRNNTERSRPVLLKAGAAHAKDQWQGRERFIQTSLREWAYAKAYQNSRDRKAELGEPRRHSPPTRQPQRFQLSSQAAPIRSHLAWSQPQSAGR
jgi:hypothetical protein